MKKKTLYIIIAIVIVLIIAIVIIKKKKSQSTGITTNNNNSYQSVPGGIKYTNDDFPLRLYSGGTKVKTMQTALNSKYSACLTVDGKFGEATLASVQAYLNATEVTEAMYNTLIVQLAPISSYSNK